MKLIKIILICLALLVSYSYVAKSQVIISYGAKSISVKPDKEAPEPRVFKDFGLQMIVPDGWDVINSESSYYYFEDNYYKLNLSDQKGDMAWVWRDKVHIDPYAKDVMEDIVFDFAPNHKHVRTYDLKGSDGPNAKLYVWEAEYLENGIKERFKLFAALNEAPVFKPRLQDAYLLGRSADMDIDGSIEEDFLRMAEYLQTYNESKKGDEFETYEQLIDKAVAEAVANVGKNLKVEIVSADSLEEPASVNGRSLDWKFQSYPGWAKDDEIVDEDPVDWMVPSVIESSLYGVKDFIQISPDYLLYFCSRGIYLVNSGTEKLQWYKKIGYTYFNFAAGNDNQIIITKRVSGTIMLKSLETLTGEEIWSTDLSGSDPIDFHIDINSNSMLVVQYADNQTQLTSIDLITGDISWTVSRDHLKDLNSPHLPSLLKNYLLVFCDGIEAISLKTGESAWKIDKFNLNEGCPTPRIFNDTVFIIASDNTINIIDGQSGALINSFQGRKDSEYTNIFILNNRLYLRGKKESTKESEEYYLDVYSEDDSGLLWSYIDSLPTISSIIVDGSMLYTSFWNGPVALNKNTGEVLFRSAISETGRTYPVTIRKYGDTIVYVGELIIAGVDSKTGTEVFKLGFNPVSQSLNLDAIDPQIIKHYDYLKFFGKPGLKEVTPEMGNVNILFNLSSASQERATQLASMSRQNASMYRFTGNDSYYYKSKMQANSYQIENAFSRAYRNSALLLGSVNTAASAVSKMTEQERNRLTKLYNSRSDLATLYESQESMDYIIRKSELIEGIHRSSKTVVVHLPSGKVIHEINDNRSMDDIIIDPQKNMIYYHYKRIVPELLEFSRNNDKGTAAHAYYLIAQPLFQ